MLNDKIAHTMFEIVNQAQRIVSCECGDFNYKHINGFVRLTFDMYEYDSIQSNEFYETIKQEFIDMFDNVERVNIRETYGLHYDENTIGRASSAFVLRCIIYIKE